MEARHEDRRARNLRGDLRHSWLDGALYAAMVGVGESYFPAFVLAAGHGELAAGWVATLPMLTGAALQLVTPSGVARLGSHRRWVVACATAQALAFAPLLVAALAGAAPAALIFASVAAYWAFGLAAAPAWNTWITTLVPGPIRSRYFAMRTRASHAATFGAMLAAGAWLQFSGAGPDATLPFAALFAAAALARFVSSRHLANQSEPEPIPAGFRAPSLREVLGSPAMSGSRRLILYMLALQAAVQAAAPFYSPYVLGELDRSYAVHMALIASTFLARVVALPYCGRWARRVGSLPLLWLGGIGLVVAAIPWTFTRSIGALLAAQLVLGAAWAAYELATFLMLFEHVPERERTGVMTLFNLGNSLAIAIGSLAGGALLAAGGSGARAYTALFVLSVVARAATLLLLRRVHAAKGAAFAGNRGLARSNAASGRSNAAS